MPKHPTRGLIRALSTLLKRARACWMSALALYLTKPVDEFSMLTTADQQALATVLRRGDVLLSAGSTRCAELVKRLTQSRWSHVSMYVGALEDASDPLCVVEAHIAGGVRAIRLSELDARRICVLRPVGLDDTDRGRLVESVLRYIGSEYDFAHAWLLARSLLLRRWWTRRRSVTATLRHSATRFICSSLIAHAFAMIGYSLLPPEASVPDRDGDHNLLVPADFDRASLFAIVWPADRVNERI